MSKKEIYAIVDIVMWFIAGSTIGSWIGSALFNPTHLSHPSRAVEITVNNGEVK